MRKLIFIIVLFFSTSVIAETWVKVQSKYGLDFYQSQGYEVVDVKSFKQKEYIQLVYSLTHPEGGFKICNVWIGPDDKPGITECFTEDITD
jgi:hypothetical protein